PTDPTTGAWTATAAAPHPSGPVSAAATDAAGNAGPEASTPWTSADITPPDTDAAGTTITVGAITSDGVINSAEAASNVPVTVTLANVPADSATSMVTVFVDDVPYGATSNGDGTWTAQVPGAALAAAATPTVTAEATFSDAAGNTSAPISDAQGYSVDTTAPTASVALALDTGTSGDGITSEGTVNVGGLEALATWEYSTDGGDTWSPGAGTSFVLDDGTYLDGNVVVRQTDLAGNASETSLPGTVTVRGLLAVSDAADVDLGSKLSQEQPPITDESLVVIGLLDDGATTNGVPITVAAGATGDVVIQVRQDALLSVADAFNIEIYDATGTRVYVATAGNDPLVGDALGLDILGVTGDGTVTASVTGLAPGNYTIVVRKGDSALGTLLDADGNGVSLEELGQGGIVLGAGNQAIVLAAVETSLNASPGAGLGTVVRGVLEGVLGLTTQIGAGELVDVVTSTLDTLNLTSSLDAVLGAVADALLNNTLSLIQDTSVTVTLTEHGFANAGDPTQGNVIDPDALAQGEAGEDRVVPGSVVTTVQNSSGVSVPAGQSIAGLHGTLIIAADGAYTYVPGGNPASVGQTETFTYTISDGTHDAQANLVFTIDGSRVSNDTAQAGVEYENVVTAGPSVADALSYGWVLGIGGAVIPTFGSSLIGDTFLVAADTTQDVTLQVDVSGLVGLGVGGTLFVEERNGNLWTPVNSYDIGQLVDLLDLGGPTRLVASGLEEGEYRTRIALTIPLGVAGSVSVDTQSQVIHTGDYEVSQVFAAEGNLLENDLRISGQTLQINDSGTYVDVVAGTPETVAGTHGSLTLSADGSFIYEPFTTGSHLTGPVVDVFDYQLLSPDGQLDQGQLLVTVQPSGAGVDPAAPALPMMSFFAAEDAILLGTAFDDILVGGAAHDTLSGNGGSDTFRWDDLDAKDDAGGNGVDTITDFTIGLLDSDADADVIDLSQLLGSPTEDIEDYVNVTQANGSTVISIDRDGTGSGHGFAPLVTLPGDSMDLQQLLAQQQLIV
ncbi:MAG: type I secretion C-terminal target domain-containing protein, partial [Comamonadaceae bacterium]